MVKETSSAESAGRLRRVLALVEQALTSTEVQREQLLDECGRTDAELAREARRILAGRAELGSFLEPKAGFESAAAGEITGSSLLGQRVGGFVLVEPIALGGMGSVFLAEQEYPRRRVALKLMASRVDSPVARARFQREAEILGRLQHPGIATIHSAGIHHPEGVQTAAGLPWFAMELVEEAQNLVVYAEQSGLGPAQRLRLFLQVCAAVQHGHERGVVHRDIKPDNVLVDVRGRIKLIDFGIACLLESEGRQGNQATRTGDLLGTLAYMSPEQVSGKRNAVDARSDVYSLGALLYELTCGRAPHAQDDGTPLDLLRALQDRSIARPGELRPGLARDLELILLKALAEEPRARYACAGELEADVLRFLNGEAVAARAPTRVYRLKRWTFRRRKHLAAALVLVAVLLVSLFLRTQRLRILEQRAQQGEFMKLTAAAELDRVRVDESLGALRAAGLAWENYDALELEQQLLRVAPELRGFEWHYLRNAGAWGRELLGSDELRGRLPWLEYLEDGRLLCGWAGKNALILDTSRPFREELEVAFGRWSMASLNRADAVLAVSPADGEIEIWGLRPAPARLARMTIPERRAVASIHLAAGRDLLILGRTDGSVQCWDWGHETERWRIPAHRVGGVIVATSADGELCASGGEDGVIVLRNVESGAERGRAPGQRARIQALAFGPGEQIAFGCEDGSVGLWSASQSGLSTLKAHNQRVHEVAFTREGRYLVSCSDDQSVLVHDLETWRTSFRFLGHETGVRSVAVDRGVESIVSADSSGRVRVWSSDSTSLRPLLPASAQPQGWSSRLGAGRYFFVQREQARTSSALHAVDVRTTDPSRVLDGLAADVIQISSDRLGRRLALREAGGRVSVVDLADGGRLLLELRSGLDPSRMELAPDGSCVIGYAPDRQLRLTGIDSPAPAWPTEVSSEIVGSWAFDPSSKRIALGATSGNIHLVDLADGALRATLAGGSARIGAMAFAADGSLFAAAQADGTLRVWQAEDWSEIARASTGESALTSLAIAPQKDRLVSGAGDGTLTIWQLPGLRPLVSPEHFPLPVGALIWDEGSTWLAVVLSDGSGQVLWAGEPAWRIVRELERQHLLRADVERAIREDPALDEATRARALEEAAKLVEDLSRIRDRCVELLARSSLEAQEDEHLARLLAALRSRPGPGVADSRLLEAVRSYRAGDWDLAAKELDRGKELSQALRWPELVRAMALARTGHPEEAQAILAETREWVRTNNRASPILQGYLREAADLIEVSDKQ